MATKFRRPQGGGAGSKIVDVNDRLGVKGISEQQGTTRVIIDSLLLTATTGPSTLTFFQGCGTRQFPLTNLDENKLQVKESIVLQRLSMYIMVCDPAVTGVPTVIRNIVPLQFLQEFQMLYGSWFNFNVAENQVIKKLPLTAMQAPFNKDAKFYGLFQTQPLATDPVTSHAVPHDVFKFDNDIVVPPQVQFTAPLQIPKIPAIISGVDCYLTVKLSGLGSLYAPKARF